MRDPWSLDSSLRFGEGPTLPHFQVLAGIREVVYQRSLSLSLPLVTGDLQILPSMLESRAGVVGAATLAIEHVVSPAAVERLVAERAGARAA